MSVPVINRIQTRSRLIFYGWWIVAVGFIINALGVGVHFYGLSAFLVPMREELGWSMAVITLGYSFSRLEGGITAPFDGWLVDRFGSRKMLMVGALLAGLGFMAFSNVNTPVAFYLVKGLILAEGFSLGFNHSTNAAVAKWFIRKRGKALSILTLGNGVGGAIFVPLIAFLIVQVGWRMTAMYIGIALIVVVLPLALIIRDTPEKMGLKPDGDTDLDLSESPGPADQENLAATTEALLIDKMNLTVKDALKMKTFWFFTGAMMLRAGLLSTIVILQIPHLQDVMGFSSQAASTALGMMVLFSLPGRFIFGFLGDRFSKRKLLFILCLLQGIGVLILINAHTLGLVYLFLAVYATGYGGMMPLVFALPADLFGRKNFATIVGASRLMAMATTVSMPFLAGLWYDAYNNYYGPFVALMVMIVLGGVMFLIIPSAVKSVTGRGASGNLASPGTK